VISNLQLALNVAAEGSRVALAEFDRRTYAVRRKADGTPVTDADLTVERLLRERIAEHLPYHQIIGEEAGQTGRSDWCWYIDPIDGTSDFIAGGARWMLLVALVHLGEVLVGVASVPRIGERWWASSGQGAFRAGMPIAVSKTRGLANAVVSDDWQDTLAQGVTRGPLAALARSCASVRPYMENSFLAVAAGLADVAIDTGGHPWDYAALKIIVEEAGGRVTDRDGKARIDGGHAIASNGLVHEAVLDVIADDGHA
jgi:histidinol-phosphatase